MPQVRRRRATWAEPSRARRRVGRIGCLALLAGLALTVQAVSAGDFESGGSRPSASAVPYHDGPADRAPLRAPDRAAGVDELLGLSVLAAILYGLRVSDLGRGSRPR